MRTSLTLMAVHAHPDDESSSTGGVLARYADEGVRTVVVTCTNGELGDAPGGIKPGDEGHDEAEVARIRLGELKRACRRSASRISSCSGTTTRGWTTGSTRTGPTCSATSPSTMPPSASRACSSGTNPTS